MRPNALGYPMHYTHPEQIMAEIASLTPTFAGVSYRKLDQPGSIQWPCNDEAPEGTPTMDVGGCVRGKGRFFVTQYVASDEKADVASHSFAMSPRARCAGCR
jgi:formate dehydrogenase major subunit